jgi:hypothetical protein
MKVTLHNAAVAGVGTWSDPTDNDPIKYGNGDLARFVDLLDTDGAAVRLALTADCNADVDRGELVDVQATLYVADKVGYSRGGKEYVRKEIKLRVTQLAGAGALA